jgi:6-phosphogluconolactonase/glucosamine-6-phosphate isomerase/deaminase
MRYHHFQNEIEVQNFLRESLEKHLKNKQKTLFFIPGGSALSLIPPVLETLSPELFSFLSLTLTDERYGEVNHKDSNWQQFLEKTPKLPQECFPVLQGKNKEDTENDFEMFLKNTSSHFEKRIGLFGMGADGHIAGILPESKAVDSQNLCVSYKGGDFYRITLTFKAFSLFDEIFLFAKGENKWPMIENLKKDIPLPKMPAQIIKTLPMVTVFSDYPF